LTEIYSRSPDNLDEAVFPPKALVELQGSRTLRVTSSMIIKYIGQCLETGEINEMRGLVSGERLKTKTQTM
jgi:hypothetical protein